MKVYRYFAGACLLLVAAMFASCGSGESTGKEHGLRVADTTRIVSLNGTITEILCAIGYEKNIVGIDVTSTYPASILGKPQVGHNRNMSAEGIVALRPHIVLGLREFMKPELVDQLRAAGATVLIFDHQHSVEGAKALITAVADSLHYTGNTAALTAAIDQEKQAATPLAKKPGVLFIYARGAGTLMAAGTNTAVNSIISLAGASNVVTGYENFKPLTTEALVTANPDVILLFDTGLASLGGMDGLLQVPGVANTTAGRTRRVVEMDGQLLTGFGPRTGKAIAMLSKKLDEASRP